MNSKKAQSEIITTVLIILLVLAAIIIVWQVVQTTIGKAKGGIDDNSLCIGSNLVIVKAVANTSASSGNITVSREPSSSTNEANVTVRLFVNGEQKDITMAPLAVYSKDTAYINLTVGDQVKVAAVLSQDGYLCPATAAATVVAP